MAWEYGPMAAGAFIAVTVFLSMDQAPLKDVSSISVIVKYRGESVNSSPSAQPVTLLVVVG
jgi:hypothetical protein